MLIHCLQTDVAALSRCAAGVWQTGILTRFLVWQRAGFLRGCFCGQYAVIRGESGYWKLPCCYLHRLSGHSCVLVELVFTQQPSGQEFIPSTVPDLCGVVREVASTCRAAADPYLLAGAWRCHQTALQPLQFNPIPRLPCELCFHVSSRSPSPCFLGKRWEGRAPGPAYTASRAHDLTAGAFLL